MPVIKQTNLSGGILRKDLWSRTELPKYPTYVKRCENFYVTSTGQLANRPGTVYCGLARGLTIQDQYAERTPARLIPFVFSNGQSYVIEFSNLRIRVWEQGSVILANGGASDVITSTYETADINNIKYSQVGDELWLACDGFPVRILRREAALDWTITDASFLRTVSAPTGLAFVGTPDQTGDDTHTAKEWEWKVTAWNSDSTDESLPSTGLTPGGNGKIVVTEDRPVTIQWNAVGGTSRYSVYRGRNKLFGYIGDAIDQTFFRDDGNTPVLSSGPPIGYDPTASSEYPFLLSFYQQRLLLANLPSDPAGVYFSRLGTFRNFDYQEPALEDDGFQFYLASKEFEEIRNLVPMDGFLYILTNAGGWIAIGAGGDPLDGTSLPFLRPQNSQGSSWVDPIILKNTIVYQNDGGYPIRQVGFTSSGADVRDLSIMADLPRTSPIIGWCYQRRPDSIIWAYDEDGNFYSLTLTDDTDIMGWAKHFTPNGKVVSMACIPEGGEDAVYFCVARAQNFPYEADTHPLYTIERMGSRNDTNPILTSSNFLDCSVHFNGENTNKSARLRLTNGVTWRVGDTVTITSSVAIFDTGDANVGDWIVLHPRDFTHRIYLAITDETSTTTATARILPDSVTKADPEWRKNSEGIMAWTKEYQAFIAPISRPSYPEDDISDTRYQFDHSDWGWARNEFDLDVRMPPFPPQDPDWTKQVTSTKPDIVVQGGCLKADGDVLLLNYPSALIPPGTQHINWQNTYHTNDQPWMAWDGDFVFGYPLSPKHAIRYIGNVKQIGLDYYYAKAVYVSWGLPYTQRIETLDIPYVVGQGIDQTLNVKAIKKAGFFLKSSSAKLIQENRDYPESVSAPVIQIGETPDGPFADWTPEVGQELTDLGPGSEDWVFTGLIHTPIFNSWNRQGRIALVNNKPVPVTVCGILREFEIGGT